MDKSALIKSPHGFMDRKGGVSNGLYESLNCGLGSKDDPKAVHENRARVAQSVAGQALPIITPYQVHGKDAHFIGEGFDPSSRLEGDALVTRRTDILIGILTADCCPVLFEDFDAGLVGAAHAGWKGAAKGVVEATLSLMEKNGAKIERIRVAIGPTIGVASYEVKGDMRDAVLKEDAAARPFFENGRDGDHYQFDLPGYVKSRLIKAGLKDIDEIAIDTYQSARHFSYRRSCHRGEGDYGRFLSVIKAPSIKMTAS